MRAGRAAYGVLRSAPAITVRGDAVSPGSRACSVDTEPREPRGGSRGDITVSFQKLLWSAGLLAAQMALYRRSLEPAPYARPFRSVQYRQSFRTWKWPRTGSPPLCTAASMFAMARTISASLMSRDTSLS